MNVVKFCGILRGALLKIYTLRMNYKIISLGACATGTTLSKESLQVVPFSPLSLAFEYVHTSSYYNNIHIAIPVN